MRMQEEPYYKRLDTNQLYQTQPDGAVSKCSNTHGPAAMKRGTAAPIKGQQQLQLALTGCTTVHWNSCVAGSYTTKREATQC